MACPKPSRIIVDEGLFNLEFTPDMTQAGKEAIVRERYAIAMSNHKMVEKMLAEAEAEAKQVLWQLAALQPELYSSHADLLGFVDDFRGTKGFGVLMEAISLARRTSKDLWEFHWNEEWLFTEADEKEVFVQKEIALARAAGVLLPLSPSR